MAGIVSAEKKHENPAGEKPPTGRARGAAEKLLVSLFAPLKFQHAARPPASGHRSRRCL